MRPQKVKHSLNQAISFCILTSTGILAHIKLVNSIGIKVACFPHASVIGEFLGSLLILWRACIGGSDHEANAALTIHHQVYKLKTFVEGLFDTFEKGQFTLCSYIGNTNIIPYTQSA